MVTIEQARLAKDILNDLYEDQNLCLGITGKGGNFAVSAKFEKKEDIPNGFVEAILVQYVSVPVIPVVVGKVKFAKNEDL